MVVVVVRFDVEVDASLSDVSVNVVDSLSDSF